MRILVYNIAYGTGSPLGAWEMAAGVRNYIRTPERYFDAIKRMVRRCRADAAGFLEVDGGSFRTRGKSQLQELTEALDAERMPARSKYAPDSPLNHLPYWRWQTNALLVRSGLSQQQKVDFMPCGTKRLILECKVQDIDILLVHLALGRGVRRKQLEYLTALVQNRKRCIVCGDFNTFGGSRELTDFFNNTGFESANKKHSATYPARQPVMELDYILYSPDLDLKSFRIVQFPGSDHLPLLADFN
ncbi:MAG: hypothetical protein E7056_02260 [Lentisphaerae bacterium]|nr:hypothetical protein [Lentisphaerota bacterium]